MILGSKKSVQDEHQLVLRAENHTIDKVSTQRLLSIFIDDHLSWTSHIDHLCSTLTSKISLLRQNSAYVPQDVQKLYYQSYIVPLLDYGCNTWGTTSGSNLERLSKLQKRAAQIILKADFMTTSWNPNLCSKHYWYITQFFVFEILHEGFFTLKICIRIIIAKP